MICSTFARVPCHSRSRSTTTVYTNIPRTYESSDDDAGRWTGNFNGGSAEMYYRSRAATVTLSAPRYYAPSKPETPKSAATTEKSITGLHVRRRYQDQTRDDFTGRRRSANADILESLGLPSMVSFQDMKTLQDGLREEDIRGPRKGHRRQHARRVSECLSQSLSSVVRLARKVTPPSMHTMRQKNAPAVLDEKPVRAAISHAGGDTQFAQFRFPTQWTMRQRNSYTEAAADEKTL